MMPTAPCRLQRTQVNKLATTVKHLSIEVSARHRASMLEDIITYYGKGSHAIVFTNSKAECDELADGQTFKTLTSQVCFFNTPTCWV